MAKKKRQMCDKCDQITTHEFKKPEEHSTNKAWVCLCCESARYRTNAENEKIQSRKSKKLNLDF